MWVHFFSVSFPFTSQKTLTMIFERISTYCAIEDITMRRNDDDDYDTCEAAYDEKCVRQ